jgi:GT2 family glycosyltransferase
VSADEVSVVVVSYGRPAELARCLEGLLRQTVAPGEIVVVLRPQDAAGRASAARFADAVRVVPVDRPGQVAALNAGRAAARGALLCFVDDDAVPAPDWVARIVAWFAADDAIGAVGGRDVVHHGDVIDGGPATRVGHVSWWGRITGRHHRESTVQDVQFLKGANMAYRAVALRPFDERLWGTGAQVCNDLEASLSVHRRGWRLVYDPDVRVDHFPAHRWDEDQRGARTLEAERAEQHNELYALLRNVPLWQAPLVIGYRVLVGYRRAPGVMFFLVDVARAREVSPARRRELAALTQARAAAVGTWVRAGRRTGTLAPGPRPARRG